MIGCTGLLKLTKLMTALDTFTQYQEIIVAPHAFKPNTVCFTHAKSIRSFQAQLHNDLEVLEINYMPSEQTSVSMVVDDVSIMVKRIMAYFNGHTNNI